MGFLHGYGVFTWIFYMGGFHSGSYRLFMGYEFLRGWMEVGEKGEESVKRVVDRSLYLEHALMEESLQSLCPNGQSQQSYVVL
jgi:hypothetical protein